VVLGHLQIKMTPGVINISFFGRINHFQIKIAPGVINISFFGRIKCGACPLSDQNDSWSKL